MNKCKVEVFSRVTGFFRPVQTWNKGKVAEHKDRKGYNINKEELWVSTKQHQLQ